MKARLPSSHVLSQLPHAMAFDSSPEYLAPPPLEGPQRNREAVKRRNLFDIRSLAESEVEEAITDGWVKDRPTGKRIRMKRPKSVDEKLENRFWMLLFKLGYPELNAGSPFTNRCYLAMICLRWN
jgi:hypothetical protein